MAAIPVSLTASFIKSLPIRTVEKGSFKFDRRRGRIEWDKGTSDEYRLVVDGLTKERKIFSYPDIMSFPRTEQVSDFHCVEGWSVKDLKWSGFRFKEIMGRIEVDKNATHVLFHSFGTTGSSPGGQSNYIECLSVKDLLDPGKEILLATAMDSKPLPEENGGPLRLISPYHLGYKSIKYISRIEFVDAQRPGWWTLANPIYTIEARVPQSRLRQKTGK